MLSLFAELKNITDQCLQSSNFITVTITQNSYTVAELIIPKDEKNILYAVKKYSSLLSYKLYLKAKLGIVLCI